MDGNNDAPAPSPSRPVQNGSELPEQLALQGGQPVRRTPWPTYDKGAVFVRRSEEVREDGKVVKSESKLEEIGTIDEAGVFANKHDGKKFGFDENGNLPKDLVGFPDRGMTITVKADKWSKYRIQFIGKGGRILQESLGTPAEYVFRGGEGYVRGKILESNGRTAWTQPVIVK